MNKLPSGFIASCPTCGVNTGAMDYDHMDRRGAGKLLGQWLHDGQIVTPQFSAFTATVQRCQCKD